MWLFTKLFMDGNVDKNGRITYIDFCFSCVDQYRLCNIFENVKSVEGWFPWDDSLHNCMLLTHVSRKIPEFYLSVCCLYPNSFSGKIEENKIYHNDNDKDSGSHFYDDKAYSYNQNILITRNDGQTAIMYYLFDHIFLSLSICSLELRSGITNLYHKTTHV